MSPNTIIALSYLMLEAVNAGIRLSDLLSKVDAEGALPKDEVEKIRGALKDDFDRASDFWK